MFTLRTHPAPSAVYIDEEEKGSAVRLRILDESTIGSPFLFPDLAARRARIDSAASVWKKCPGSVDRDIVAAAAVVSLLEAIACCSDRGVDLFFWVEGPGKGTCPNSCRDPR
jgi:hypothetical protein